MRTNAQTIQDGIDNCGVFLFAIADFLTCAGCGQSNCQDASHSGEREPITEVDECFVYTVGHRLRGRPDMVMLCGPAPEDPPAGTAELHAELDEAARLLNYMVEQWAENPVLAGQTCGTSTGRLYRVLDRAEAVAQAKKDLTIQAGEYYGDQSYALLVLVPVGWQGQPWGGAARPALLH